jgi:cystathionine beta-lyase/cystathionine gamma-synthase
MKFATRAIHAGQPSEPRTGAVVVPIFQTSTYHQDGIDKPRSGFEYARTQNPTRSALEETIASLESARHGLCFSSGSAATSALIHLLKPGDEVLSTVDVYGGTYRQLRMVYEKYGILSRFLRTHEAADVLNALSPATRMILLETPTNPMLNVIDIAAVAQGKGANRLLVVDNTFATPVFQRPIELGADVVFHSTTKYMGGHSDVVGGALATNDAEIYAACKFHQNAVGAVPGPFDCFLVQRGIKTVELRMKRHDENARKVAAFLKTHPAVERVYFPGDPDSPGYEVARKQMSGLSGMVSFTMKGGRQRLDPFFSKLRIFMLAESLGGVESLVCYPSRMTHASIPEAERNAIGITDSLCRLSVGIEDADDLVADLAQALS